MTTPFWVWGQSVIWTLVHLYVWARLVKGTTLPGTRARRLGNLAAIVLAPFIPAALIGGFELDAGTARWVLWPGYVWYAFELYLALTLIAAEPVRPAVRVTARLRRRRAQPPPEPLDEAPAPTRRVFLSRSIAAVAGTATAGIVGYGMPTALGPPRLDRVTVRLNRGGPRLAGTRIALVGDIHLGPMLGRGHTQRIVDMINRTAPDLVAIVGDLVDGTVEDLAYAAAPLRDLRSRLGTYFVTGNHEYLSGVTEWVEHLRDLGVRPLQNERLELPMLDIAGVNDVTGAERGAAPDYDRALAGRDPSRPVVLLAHQPVQVRESVRHGVDLQLSGHTHGGQTYPLDVLTSAAQPLMEGHARFGGTQLYVTKGAGFWGPPVRVGAPPDITLIELAT